MLLSFLLAFLLMVLGRNGLAASVEDAAKAEGNVVLYGTMSAPDLARLVQAFEKRYPAIKVQSFRANSERVLNRPGKGRSLSPAMGEPSCARAWRKNFRGSSRASSSIRSSRSWGRITRRSASCIIQS
jgi:hypothetical protein